MSLMQTVAEGLGWIPSSISLNGALLQPTPERIMECLFLTNSGLAMPRVRLRAVFVTVPTAPRRGWSRPIYRGGSGDTPLKASLVLFLVEGGSLINATVAARP